MGSMSIQGRQECAVDPLKVAVGCVWAGVGAGSGGQDPSLPGKPCFFRRWVDLLERFGSIVEDNNKRRGPWKALVRERPRGKLEWSWVLADFCGAWLDGRMAGLLEGWMIRSWHRVYLHPLPLESSRCA